MTRRTGDTGNNHVFVIFRTCERSCLNAFWIFRPSVSTRRTCVLGKINAFVLNNHAVVTRRRSVTENINAFVNCRTCEMSCLNAFVFRNTGAPKKYTSLPGAALVNRGATHDQRETSMPL